MLCAATVFGASWLLPQLDDVDVVAWYHVPKTSGFATHTDTVLQLKAQGTVTYPETRTFPHPGSIGENFASGCQHSHWHCTPGEMDECLRLQHPSAQRVGWMTVVRDPVQRVLSEYSFYRGKRMYYGWTNSMIAASDADNLEAWIVDENNTAHNKQAMYLLFDHGYPNMPSVRGVFNAQGCSPMVDAAKTVEWARRSSGGLSGFNTDGRLAAMLGRRFEELLVFAVVFEERQRSYDIFSRTFGVGLPCEKAGASHQSQRSVGQPPQAHIEALIRERNALDLVLVGMARELLDRYNVTATDSAKPLPACRIVAKPHKGKRGGKLVMDHS